MTDIIRKTSVYLFLSIFIFFSFIFPTHHVDAVTDDFTVRTLVGGDTTPPSVPSALVATPVAVSQIDLVWASSTDDYILSGYNVWRGDSIIATTTLTTYSDVGLTASTTYSYYVTAFDSSGNVSASSTIVSATTLSPAPAAAVSGQTYGSYVRQLGDEIISLEIFPQRNSVNFKYETRGNIRTAIRWGRTDSYELGSLVESTFKKGHDTEITGLIPNTKYTFQIEGENGFGNYGLIHNGTFQTLPPEDIFPPGNVTNLRLRKEDGGNTLSWINPKDPDLVKIRVVRSDRFYPSDIADGWVIYEGLGTEVYDAGVASSSRQYYSVFTYDELGNVSSGAVIATPRIEKDEETKNEIDPTINLISLRFDGMVFTQEGSLLPIKDGSVRIDGSKLLTISIPYEQVPEHLKTILVTVIDSRDHGREFSFLLRVNADKTMYSGTLSPFGTTGDFPLRVTIFDFKTEQIGYTDGVIASYVSPIHSGLSSEGFFSSIVRFISSGDGMYSIWFIVLLILLLYFGRRLVRTQW
ncbi:MAG: hypothetical protein K9M10_00665 [Candidatus Pacebacteria bacterium]|nr:hypothetical protein [Candidatus Paceibacterota bacterium]MCF7856975.1 hypothetical protein [Candidatus Paceibacterota bacterium]